MSLNNSEVWLLDLDTVSKKNQVFNYPDDKLYEYVTKKLHILLIIIRICKNNEYFVRSAEFP